MASTPTPYRDVLASSGTVVRVLERQRMTGQRWRHVALILIGSLMFSVRVPEFVRFATGSPYGDYGFSVGLHGVDQIDKGGAADRAGMRIGDRIHLHDARFEDRQDIINQGTAAPGKVTLFPITRQGKPITLRLVSQPLAPLPEQYDELVLDVACIALLVIGTALVWLRPCRMTWGFYVFSLLPIAAVDPTMDLPPLWAALYYTAGMVLGRLGYVGFMVFALRFPNDRATGWKAKADALAPAFAVVLAGAAAVATINYRVFAKSHGPAMGNFLEWGHYLVYAVAAASLLTTLISSTGQDRQRLKWVVAGCLVGFAWLPLYIVSQYSDWLFHLVREWATFLFPCMLLVIPLSVAYAVLAQRVIDLRFVVSRTLVYGVLIAAFVACLGILDWLSVRFLSGTRLEIGLAVAAALIFGFAFRPLVVKVQNLVDQAFFKDRFNARRELGATADLIRRATSVHQVEELLTSHVAEALDLASAAAFRVSEDGGFVREASVGWPHGTSRHVLTDDAAIANLRSTSPQRIDWTRDLGGLTLPSGLASPVLAMPVLASGQLPLVILYGAHRGGTDLSVDERDELRFLSVEAAGAWRSFVSPDAGRLAPAV